MVPDVVSPGIPGIKIHVVTVHPVGPYDLPVCRIVHHPVVVVIGPGMHMHLYLFRRIVVAVYPMTGGIVVPVDNHVWFTVRLGGTRLGIQVRFTGVH